MEKINLITMDAIFTDACNLDCKYCITASRKNLRSKIDVNFAKLGILEHIANIHKPWIRFYGAGECTLEFDMIKELIEFSGRSTDKKTIFEIQTNGFFSEKIANFIGDNFDIVYISCDGPPEINNYHRRTKDDCDTSDVIERNIKIISGTTNVYIRSTITKYNVFRQIEMLEYFKGMNVNCVFSKPVLNKVDLKQKNKLSVDLKKYAEEFVKAYKYALKHNIFYGNIYIVNFDKPTKIFCRACKPYPHLTPDGFVSCCDRAYTGSTSLSDLIYGRYNSKRKRIEYNQDKINNIKKRNILNMAKCRNCEIKYSCGGSCLGTSYQYSGDMFIPDIRECEIIKYFYDNIWPIKDINCFHP